MFQHKINFCFCIEHMVMPKWFQISTKWKFREHTLAPNYGDVIMGTIASQITSPTSVYSTVNSGADQSKHQSSASLAIVWGIHRGPVNSPHKGPVTRKMFPFDVVIMMPHDKAVVFSYSASQNLCLMFCFTFLEVGRPKIFFFWQPEIRPTITTQEIYSATCFWPNSRFLW